MPKVVNYVFVLIILLVFLYAFSASYSSQNIDNLAYVVAMGIDSTDNDKIQVTFQFTQTSAFSNNGSSGSGDASSFTDTVESSSISSAINLINAYVGKEVYFGVRPEDIHYQAAPAAENNMALKVTNKEPLGAETHVFLQVQNSNIVAKVAPEVVVQLGDTVNFCPDLARSKFFDLETEVNICEPEIEKKW